MSEIKLQCSCANVRGVTTHIDGRIGNRVVCCCDDCQSFAQFLGQEGAVLDQYGGTDIFQIPISYLNITSGSEQIACMKLSSKGLYRWFAKCCNTPIGNSMGPGAPFIGLIHSFMSNHSSRDQDLGVSRGHIQTKFAIQQPPEHLLAPRTVLFRSLAKLALWKAKGLNRPTAFFDDEGKPIAKPQLMS